MRGYEQTCPEVDAIGQINFHGDGVFTPNNWYHNIRRDNGKTYIEAVVLLADIVSWYLPIYERDEITGKTIAIKKKFKADKLQRTYDAFAEHYGMTKDQARNALRKLSDMNLIDLDFRTVDTGSQKLGNVLFVGVNPDRVKEITFTLSPQKPIGAIPTETDSYPHRNRQVSAQKPIAMPSETETNTDQSTDQSTDPTTEKNKEADFVFSEIRDLKNEALDEENINSTGNAKNQEDPIPPTPLSRAAEPEKPVKQFPDPMGDRFKSKTNNRWQKVMSDRPEWQEVLTEWASSTDCKFGFKQSLLKAQIAHLKEWKLPCEVGNAMSSLSGYIKNNDLESFELRVDAAIAIEEADRRLEAMQITKPECVTTYSYLWQPKGRHTDRVTGDTTISWDRISLHEPITTEERDDRQIAILQEFLGKLQAKGLTHLALQGKYSLLKGSKVSPLDFHEEVIKVIGICLQKLAQQHQGVAA